MQLPRTIVCQDSESGQIETLNFCGGAVSYGSAPCPLRQDANEDSGCLIEVSDRLGLLAVADGVGGAALGSQASRTMIEHLVAACSRSDSTANSEGRKLRAEIVDAIDAANTALLGWANGAATTITAVEFLDGRLRTIHVGDSAAILVSNRGNIRFSTVGHAPVARAVEIGLLDEEEALWHEDRNLISNCVGSTDMKIEIGPSVPMAARDTLVIATDGLYDNLTNQEIADIIRKGDLTEQTEELVREARRRMQGETSGLPSKPDDLTIICFRLKW